MLSPPPKGRRAQGRRPKNAPPDTRRTVWVLLADVPEDKRVRAAETYIKYNEMDGQEKLELMMVARAPDPLVGAWVTPEAAAMVEGWRCTTP